MRHVKVNAKHIKTPVGLLLEAKGKKIYRSEEVNFNFDMKTGHMMTWEKLLLTILFIVIFLLFSISRSQLNAMGQRVNSAGSATSPITRTGSSMDLVNFKKSSTKCPG
ncbi:hypothetical protein IANJMKHF_00199 [Klebsiella phage CPRSA]|nr:hypothetical protein IANJMKHF_00199 [Klebsiella phage CPRSA]